MATGPCGEEFKAAFSCFVYSEAEPKGIDCVEKFKGMQDCFREHPDVYGEGEFPSSPREWREGGGGVRVWRPRRSAQRRTDRRVESASAVQASQGPVVAHTVPCCALVGTFMLEMSGPRWPCGCHCELLVAHSHLLLIPPRTHHR